VRNIVFVLLLFGFGPLCSFGQGASESRLSQRSFNGSKSRKLPASRNKDIKTLDRLLGGALVFLVAAAAAPLK
jgi:hypothetical protein